MLKVKKNYIRLTTCVIKLGFLINLRIIGEKKSCVLKKCLKRKTQQLIKYTWQLSRISI